MWPMTCVGEVVRHNLRNIRTSPVALGSVRHSMASTGAIWKGGAVPTFSFDLSRTLSELRAPISFLSMASRMLRMCQGKLGTATLNGIILGMDHDWGSPCVRVVVRRSTFPLFLRWAG